MKITLMQESQKKCDLQFEHWNVAIVGEPIDDRGEIAIDFANENSNNTYSCTYNPDEFTLNISGDIINPEELENYLEQRITGNMVLESTTLGFVEIYLLNAAISRLNKERIQIVYLEPFSYSNPKKTELFHKRDFYLSDEVPGFKAIPGATVMLSDREERKQKGVFFLGYEESRLERALEDYHMIRPEFCSLVFGVPAFEAGWEMHSFANNIRVINDKKLYGGIYYVGAENPLATMELLDEIYAGLQNNEKLFIAPIGTKPSGIGVALFASNHNDVGILYDHPKKSSGRSTNIGRWHLFDVNCEK